MKKGRMKGREDKIYTYLQLDDLPLDRLLVEGVAKEQDNNVNCCLNFYKRCYSTGHTLNNDRIYMIFLKIRKTKQSTTHD